MERYARMRRKMAQADSRGIHFKPWGFLSSGGTISANGFKTKKIVEGCRGKLAFIPQSQSKEKSNVLGKGELIE
jgi:hypothetical protein